MKNRMISIPEELDEKLKLENNASKLITDLLENHFKRSVEFSAEEKEKLMKEEQERSLAETKKEKDKEMNIKLCFQEEVGRAMTDVEYNSYIVDREMGKVISLWEFIENLRNNQNSL